MYINRRCLIHLVCQRCQTNWQMVWLHSQSIWHLSDFQLQGVVTTIPAVQLGSKFDRPFLGLDHLIAQKRHPWFSLETELDYLTRLRNGSWYLDRIIVYGSERQPFIVLGHLQLGQSVSVYFTNLNYTELCWAGSNVVSAILYSWFVMTS